jgi:hypothetical protein
VGGSGGGGACDRRVGWGGGGGARTAIADAVTPAIGAVVGFALFEWAEKCPWSLGPRSTSSMPRRTSCMVTPSSLERDPLRRVNAANVDGDVSLRGGASVDAGGGDDSGDIDGGGDDATKTVASVRALRCVCGSSSSSPVAFIARGGGVDGCEGASTGGCSTIDDGAGNDNAADDDEHAASTASGASDSRVRPVNPACIPSSSAASATRLVMASSSSSSGSEMGVSGRTSRGSDAARAVDVFGSATTTALVDAGATALPSEVNRATRESGEVTALETDDGRISPPGADDDTFMLLSSDALCPSAECLRTWLGMGMGKLAVVLVVDDVVVVAAAVVAAAAGALVAGDSLAPVASAAEPPEASLPSLTLVQGVAAVAGGTGGAGLKRLPSAGRRKSSSVPWNEPLSDADTNTDSVMNPRSRSRSERLTVQDRAAAIRL